jgi:hypothetical protein
MRSRQGPMRSTTIAESVEDGRVMIEVWQRKSKRVQTINASSGRFDAEPLQKVLISTIRT